MDLGIRDRVAIVTGASRGMGLGIARELAREGVKVAMISRGGPTLEKEADEICSRGGTAVAISADMGSSAGVSEAVARTRDKLGAPDIAVSMGFYMTPENDEGVVPGRGFESASDEQFRRTLDDFIMTVVYLTREVLPHMKTKRWGRLINLGSCCMKVPHYEDPLTLANLRVVTSGLIKSLANEYGQFGITANVIAPGPVASSAFLAYVRGLPEHMNSAEKWARNFVPVGRVGNIEDAGALATFLASERAGWITGQTILMDGGYTRSLF